MTKVDLKDAYFMVQITLEDRVFLKFTFRGNNTNLMGLHQDPKATPTQLRQLWNATDCLHRQHSYTGRVQEIGSGTCYRPDIPFRFCDKQTKTCPGTYSGHRIPWVLSELRTGKVNKIRVETRHLLEDDQITARELSQLLGRL